MRQIYNFIMFSIYICTISLFLKGCGGELAQQLSLLTTHSQTAMMAQTQIQGIVMQLQNLQSRLPYVASYQQGYTIYQALTQLQMQLMGGSTGSLLQQQVTVQVVTEQINILISYFTGLAQQLPMMTHQQLATLAPKLQSANAAITSAGVGVGFGMANNGYIPNTNLGAIGTSMMGLSGSFSGSRSMGGMAGGGISNMMNQMGFAY